MSDQTSTQVDQTGIQRAPDGTIQEPGTQQTDQTTEQDTKPDAKPKDSTTLLNDKEPEGAPEKYADFTIPEGFEINEEGLKEAQGVFKELNLSQAAAQKILDLHAKHVSAVAEAAANEVTTMREEWRKEVLADPVIGGKLKEVKATIGKAIDQHLGAEPGKAFREAMDLTGAGDHPAFIRGFYKFAQLITEGRHVNGGGPSVHGQQRPGAPTGTGAAALYPNLPSAGR